MARHVSIGQLRARCGRIIDECRRDGDTCVVTRRGKPIGVLVPWDQSLMRGGSGAEECEPADPTGPQESLLSEGMPDPDQAMDSATWGQWAAMSDEDRAAMVMAESLIRGSERSRCPSGAAPGAGWAAWAEGK